MSQDDKFMKTFFNTASLITQVFQKKEKMTVKTQGQHELIAV